MKTILLTTLGLFIRIFTLNAQSLDDLKLKEGQGALILKHFNPKNLYFAYFSVNYQLYTIKTAKAQRNFWMNCYQEIKASLAVHIIFLQNMTTDYKVVR